MAYLNVSPMISALRSSPESFEYNSGELYHIPSRHRFRFDAQNHVMVDADCGCSFLSVSRNQETALYDAFREWRMSYWRGVEINREFAAHFAPPSRLRSWLIKLTAGLHRASLTQRHRPRYQKAQYQEDCAVISAE